MKKSTICLLAAHCFLLTSGCATVFTGTKQSIRFDSNPAGAAISINDHEEGTTPQNVLVSKSLLNTKMVRLAKDGYVTKSIRLGRSFNLISLLNIFFPFLLVDVFTGSITKYERNAYMIRLESKAQDEMNKK